MGFTVQFGVVNKRVNELSQPAMSSVATYTCLLKENTSLLRPVLILTLSQSNLDQIAYKNYCQIAVFRRYYWIRDIVFVTSTIVEVHCEVDPLASHYADIIKNDCFVTYAEKAYNSMLPDTRLPKAYYSNTKILTEQLSEFDKKGVYILTAATDSPNGKTGFTQAYALSASEMKSVAQKVYGQSGFQDFLNDLYSPSQAISSCIWLPIRKDIVVEGAVAFKFGKFDMGAITSALTNFQSFTTITIELPYIDELSGTGRDYRNCEPYTIYTMWLPGVGLVELPMATLIMAGNSTTVELDISVSISVITGDINYCVYGGANLNFRVLQAHGNIGVNLPVPNVSSGASNALSGALTVAGSAVAATLVPAAAPFALGAGLQGASSLIQGVEQKTFSVGGNMSGWLDFDEELKEIKIFRQTYRTSDNPSNVANVIGRPLFQKQNISALKGFVQIGNANITTGYSAFGATNEELNMINNLLNGGVYVA